VNGSPAPTHAVDVTGSLDRGIASLNAHRAYLAGLGPGPMSDADAFLRESARQTGERFGGTPAVAFELIGF
jgi:hypothetical protein